MTGPTRRAAVAAHVALAALAYVPVLRARPGLVSADTKTYLYLDPGRLLQRAASMWDPDVGLGTVTHQTIGYLFPMGPWYWVFERIGSPDWVAQRLWLATILFAAGAGVLFLARTLAWTGSGPVVAAVAYMLSPYVLDYSTRISVILLPWAALPWLIGLAERSLHRRGWRHPAAFALVVLTVGGVNATALLFAGLGPVVWILSAAARREVSARRCVVTAAKIGVLTAAISVWWVTGLALQGAYGIEILQYTETVEAVARTSLASEVMRGLGYWFFYGNDKLGPWIEPSVPYTQNLVLLALTFALPSAALALGLAARWRYRGFFVALMAIGVLIAVGAHPYDDPAPLGSLFKSFATGSTAGLALRSTARAVPLVVLSTAILLGAGATAVARRVPRLELPVAAALVAAAMAALPPLFTGDIAVVDHLHRPEDIPAYVREAAAHLDQRSSSTRVLEIPGSDFAAYRWGNTVDPVMPYLIERPYVARELIPYGSPASADLLNALDRRLQEGVLDPAALAPVARLMGAGDIVLRNDLQFERYRTPRPRVLWDLVAEPPAAGLGAPVGFGPRRENVPVPELPLVDELSLGAPHGGPPPPELAVLPVERPAGIVRTAPAAGAVVLAGDGEGVVDAAAAGLLPRDGILRYAATLDEVPPSSRLVLTDTNRLRARRWGTVRENTGYTEGSGTAPLVDDPADARLQPFGDVAMHWYTTVEQRGATVRATRYGNPVSFTPEDRPANALDGDLETAWRVGAFAPVDGERIRIEPDGARPFEAIRFVQPLTGPRNRWITQVRVHAGDEQTEVFLDERSRTPDGQVVDVTGDGAVVEIEVLATNIGRRARYDGISGVGFAEIVLIGDGEPVRVDEVVRLPPGLLEQQGTASLPLSIVLSRLRSNPAEPVRTDEERRLARVFALPSARTFTVSGTARLSAYASDEAIDRVLGVRGHDRATSDARLPGSLRARAAAAFDGDPSTAWQPGLLAQEGHWIEARSAAAVPLDGFEMTLLTDGRHSVPARLRIETDGGAPQVVSLPPVGFRSATGTTTIPVTIDPVTTTRLRIVIEAVRPVRSIDYYSEQPVDLPVGVAEIAATGFRIPGPSGLSTDCRDDLLALNGAPFPVRITGTVDAALDRAPLDIQSCRPAVLAAGEHELRAVPGAVSAVDVDRVVLSDGTEAAPAPLVPPTVLPEVRVTETSRTSYDIDVPATDGPFWLVLGQSHNRGWRATVDGADLGEPELVDGFANGWLVQPLGRARSIRVEWTPQRLVVPALAVSGATAALCVVLVVYGVSVSRRRRVTVERPVSAARPDPPHALGGPEPELDAGVRPARPAREAAIVVVASSAAMVVAGALAAAAVALTLAATAVPVLRRQRRWAPAGILGLTGAYVVVQQARYGYPADFAWPTNFPFAHQLAWAAVLSAACVEWGRGGEANG